MKYDYTLDIMVVDGVEYSLASFRKWLIKNHESLVKSHFIKAITAKGKTTFFFDWQHIYFLASELLLTKQFTHELNSPGSQPVSSGMQTD